MRERRLRPVASPKIRSNLHSNKSRQDDAHFLPPTRGLGRAGFSRFEPVAGLLAPKRSSPSVQVLRIKPGSKACPSTCSLGQDGLPETAGRPWRNSEKRDRSWSPSDRSRRMSRRKKVLTAIVSVKRAKARRHTGPARPDAYVGVSAGFAKQNRNLPHPKDVRPDERVPTLPGPWPPTARQSRSAAQSLTFVMSRG